MTNFFLSLPEETKFFITLIGVAFLIFLVMTLLSYGPRATAQGPTILTTIGIFATFVGVAQGLKEFNPDQIQQSVPTLLAGLKTAFWGSVFGIGSALVLKFVDLFFGGRSADNQSAEDVTAADIAALLSNINTALVGREEGSLITQIKLTRQDTNDRLDAMRRGLDDTLIKISEMGSKVLIEQLESVIKDFNNRITEQFGDNFKQLNAAVKELVTWQQNYRLHVEQVTATFAKNSEQLTAIAASTAKSAESFADLVEDTMDFKEAAEDLASLIKTLNAERDAIQRTTEELAKVLNAASSAMPNVEQKMLQLTEQLVRSVQSNATATQAAIQAAQTVMSDAGTKHNESMTQIIRATHEHVTKVEQALEAELTKSLTTLGRQLSALSEKFVQDYGPLTDKLQQVVRMAERA